MLSRTLTSLALLIHVTTASYAFYVGKALTEDGSVMVGGTGEEVSSHWLEVFPAKNYAPNATVEVGVTEDASMPGQRLNISQASHTFRYLSMEYSDYEGFPAPLTNGGVNEKGVAVRDVWAQNRDELIAITPNPQTGLQYSDLARVVMERASTAREGVEIIGQMIAEYGYADYGGNSHLIADANEGWVVWEMSGGQKLWAAERLGPDVVRVLYPGYIEEFPVDFMNTTDYMGSPNIATFAIEQGWWNPNGTEPFNIWKAYGSQGGNYTARNGGYKYMSQAALENATLAMIPVSEKDLIERVRDYRIADDEAGYGQVVSLHPNMDPDLIHIWVAPTGSVTAPFNPWWLGVASVPPEYGQHRYLTADAASTFLDTDFQYQEATYFAGRIYKQALYYTCSDPETLLPIVQNMLHGFENASFSDLAWVERSAKTLVVNGQRADALDLLTFYAHTRADKALSLGKTMVDALDAYIKLAGQFRMPSGTRINDPGLGAETVNCLVGWDPDQPADQQTPLRKRK
ncbi:dipeptidase [Ascochyta rabiei]|uniref:Dipeptidase n=1 Tax=Didymella rabiei TaxID=5454 RepID=A0A163F278_DIDRA|nr:dipeptidase [Ascochyta rabiei]